MTVKACAAIKPPKVGDTAAAAAIFRAMADPQRLRILATIAQAAGEVCVCDLNDCVPLLQPTVSHHLKVLRECGLIDSTRRANWVYYRLADGAADKLRSSLVVVIPHGASREGLSLSGQQPRRRRRVAPRASRRARRITV